MQEAIRRCTLVAAAALFVAGCATCPADRAVEQVNPAHLRVPPYVESVGGTDATVMWETARQSRNMLVVEGGGMVCTQASALAIVQRVALSNLVPGTKYRCHLPGAAKARCQFITLNPGRQYYAFGVAGDNRSDPKAFGSVCRAMAHAGLDFVVHTGDIVENGTQRDQWYNEWFGPLAPLARTMPILVAWGNHEQPANRASWLHAYYPARSPFLGTSWYTFVHGSVRFIMLDNYQPLDPASAQCAWLVRTLEASREPFVVVAFHVAPYTDSAHAQDAQVKQTRRELAPLFIRHRVNLVVTGHDHLYERSEYGGTMFVIAGGAGAPLYQPQRSLNPFIVASTSVYHYVVADVAPSQIVCRAYTTKGALIDSFDLQPRALDAPLPNALATFDPPRRDYLDRETFAWTVDLRNMSTSFVTGKVQIDAPEGWLVQPGRSLEYFLARDEALSVIPCRAWPRSPKPGVYPVTTTVSFSDATNTMPCMIEVLGTEPVRAAWDFNAVGHALCWSNASAATVANGMWSAVSTTSALPHLYAAMPKDTRASSRDVVFVRMRLSGTNTVTTLRTCLSYVNSKGETNDIELAEPATVNGQWYTYVFYPGREHRWRGTALGIRLMPVAHGDVAVEIDDVRLCAPPEPSREHSK